MTLPRTRQAGVGLHVTSLPGQFGIGELGDAAHAFVDTLAAMRAGVWQFLPTGPTAYGDSPYQPLSSFAGNELLVDVAALIRLGLVSSNEADSLISLPRHTVDYGQLVPKKIALLNRAAERFKNRASGELKAARDRFQEQADSLWLHDYALFRVLKTMHGERPWPEWDAKFARRDAVAMLAFADKHAQQIQNIKTVQFLFDLQWKSLRRHAHTKGVSLFGDMPIYIALDSADAWAHPDILMIDRDGRPDFVAGVPPDYFSEDGQLWGNPLYNWEKHAVDGYRWWVERMRRSSMLADIVRIDHFRGFESYWSVPIEQDTARIGDWIPGPGDEIFDAMRSSLGTLPIVAEDLGVITPEVETLRDRQGIPGMKVLQFEVADSEFDPTTVPNDCVCYTGTHDNDTTVGWFAGSPGDKRSDSEIRETQLNALKFADGTPDSIHDDMVRLAFATSAQVAIAPLQDYLGLGSAARFNTPGTSGNNWRWRVLEEQLTPTLVERVRRMIEESKRDAGG